MASTIAIGSAAGSIAASRVHRAFDLRPMRAILAALLSALRASMVCR